MLGMTYQKKNLCQKVLSAKNVDAQALRKKQILWMCGLILVLLTKVFWLKED